MVVVKSEVFILKLVFLKKNKSFFLRIKNKAKRVFKKND
jgi:hypothetical protein